MTKKEDIKRLDTFEMWIWQRLEKISWIEKVSNKKGLEEDRRESKPNKYNSYKITDYKLIDFTVAQYTDDVNTT